MIKKILSLLGLWKSTAPSGSEIFPYQYKNINGEKIPDPLITLKLETKHGLLQFKFLLDSGADVTTLPLDPFAKLLGITPDQSKKTVIAGVEGGGIDAYPASIFLSIGKEQISIACFLINSKTIPLLGRKDLWDKYSIFFDNKQKQIVLEKAVS